MRASDSPVSEAPPVAVVAGARRPNWPAFYWLATVALIVTILARAQTILVPVALSVVVAFALSPVVKRLERRLRRAPAVIVVAVVALAAVAAFGYLLERQLVDLSAQMTKYSDSIGKKVLALRGPAGGALSGLSKSVDRVVRNLDEQVAANQDARPVRVVPAQATAMERIQDTLAPIAEPVGRAVIVLVLVIVLLMKREDIRDRFIRLVGRGHVTLTTRTLDEAGHRISRFLAYQSAINGAFGVLIAAGLFSIGIPYAPLWGFVAAIFRFVPFVGTAIMMIFPAALAFAQFPGWWQMLATLGLFVGLDMLAGYVAEPMLIGAKTGVSSMAMLVSAFFWAWLWGPVGLLLSTPLTVCMAVMGKHVPRLSYLAVLLGDEPALEDDLVLYHRLLSGDEEEAEDILQKRFRQSPRGQVFDEVVIPALLRAGRDRVRHEISESDHQDVLRMLRELVELPKVTVDASAQASQSHSSQSDDAPPPLRVLGVSSRSATDETIWTMLSQLFDPTKVLLESVGSAYLASEAPAAQPSDRDGDSDSALPDLMCVIAIPPGGLTQARYICRRLRAKLAATPILVIRPGLQADAKDSAGRLIDDGASQVCFTLVEAHAVAEHYLVRGQQTLAAIASREDQALPRPQTISSR